MNVDLLNERISPPDKRDLVLENLVKKTDFKSKDYIDYRKDMPPVWDQGKDGPCSSYVAAAIKMWQEKKDYDLKEQLSKTFIYNIRYDKSIKGISPRMTMQLLRKYGIPTHKSYKRFRNKPISKLPKWVLDEAINHRIKGYARIDTIQGLKKSLELNGPAYMSMPVYNEGSKFWKSKYNQKLLGGHAITVVGFNNEGFIIRNSWGQNWANRGHTIYPYNDWGSHYEVWTIIDEDSNTLKPRPPKKRSKLGNFFKKLFG